KIVEGEIRKPRAVNPDCPQDLSDAIMKGLERKRDRRYGTGKEMAKAIEQGAGEVMFDEDRCAAYMRELFDDKIQATRKLLEQASQEDTGGLSQAVNALREESSEPKNATPRGRESAPQATPLRGVAPKKRDPNATRAAP